MIEWPLRKCQRRAAQVTDSGYLDILLRWPAQRSDNLHPTSKSPPAGILQRLPIIPLHLLALGALTLALLWHNWQIITAEVPLDLYEGTMLLITGIIAAGDNPYTLPFQPHNADVYPPLYNILAAPLSAVFGNTFQLHRALSAVQILASCALLAGASYRRYGSKTAALATAALAYAALLFYATPVSSTNALGVLLFLLTVLIPWRFAFSPGSLAAAALCALLAFYSKQYFILGMAMVCLYVFLYHSMSRALLLGAMFAAALLGSVVLVHWTSPYYLDNTWFAPSAAISGLQTWDILGLQLRTFSLTYAGLLLALAGCAWNRWRTGRPGADARSGRQFAAGGWSRPLLARPMDYFWFCLFWATMAIVVTLGRNPGNYMTYLFQLMSPFLLLAGVGLLFRCNARPVLSLLLLPTYLQAYNLLHKDFSPDMQRWEEMEQLISGADEVLANQMLVASLLQQGKRVYQDGHTYYFPAAMDKPAILVKDDPALTVQGVWEAYITDIYRKIERQEFDLILLTMWDMPGMFGRHPPPFSDLKGPKFLARHYYLDRKIPLSMTRRHGAGSYDVAVWRPRKDKD